MRKDRSNQNLPNISLDQNGYSPYRKYKQNKDLYEEPLNIRGGQILSIKNKVNIAPNKFNYRYNNENENAASVPVIRDRNRNRSHPRSMIKNEREQQNQSVEVLAENQSNIDLML